MNQVVRKIVLQNKTTAKASNAEASYTEDIEINVCT